MASLSYDTFCLGLSIGSGEETAHFCSLHVNQSDTSCEYLTPSREYHDTVFGSALEASWVFGTFHVNHSDTSYEYLTPSCEHHDTVFGGVVLLGFSFIYFASCKSMSNTTKC